MENNLYYTPTLKDLHYGFEFEYKSKDDNWVKVTLDTWNRPSKDNHLKYFTEYDLLRTLNHQDMACKYEDLTCIRVKTLDQSDIESLGWESDLVSKSPFTGKELKTYTLNIISGFNTGTYWTLKATDLTYEISSNTYSSYKTYNQNIEVIIKNKSELIKLMKQLNIK